MTWQLSQFLSYNSYLMQMYTNKADGKKYIIFFICFAFNLKVINH